MLSNKFFPSFVNVSQRYESQHSLPARLKLKRLGRVSILTRESYELLFRRAKDQGRTPNLKRKFVPNDRWTVSKRLARGVEFGRKKQLTQAQCTELRKKRLDGVLIKTLMQEYNLSKASVYRYLDQE